MTTLYGNVVVNETENLTRAQDALVRRRAKPRPRAVATAMPHGGGDEVLHGQTGHVDQMAHGRLTGMGPPVARWSAVLTTTKACTPGSFTGSDLAKHSERPSPARTRAQGALFRTSRALRSEGCCVQAALCSQTYGSAGPSQAFAMHAGVAQARLGRFGRRRGPRPLPRRPSPGPGPSAPVRTARRRPRIRASRPRRRRLLPRLPAHHDGQPAANVPAGAHRAKRYSHLALRWAASRGSRHPAK